MCCHWTRRYNPCHVSVHSKKKKLRQITAKRELEFISSLHLNIHYNHCDGCGINVKHSGIVSRSIHCTATTKMFFAMIVFECKFVSFTKESLLRRFLVVLSMATPLHYGKRLIRKKLPRSCQEWGKSLGQLQYPHLDHFSQEADARFPNTWWN